MSRAAPLAGLALGFAVLAAPASAGEATDTGAIALPAPDARPALNPRLASDGHGGLLLVWQQGRYYYEQQQGDIYALRLDAEGRPRGDPIPVCTAEGSQERPQVTYAGGRFLVAWQDLRNGRDWDVYAARIDPDGKVEDRDGFLVAGGPDNQAGPALAPAADGVLAVWQHYAAPHYEIHGALLRGGREVGEAGRLSHQGAPLHGGDLALARTGDGFLLAWMDETRWNQRESGGMITRFFASLGMDDDIPEVDAVERAPAASLAIEGGRFAAGADGRALYVGWGVAGRSSRSLPTAGLFEAGQALPVKNPNNEPDLRISGWDPTRAITLFSPGTSIDGPVAVAFGHGVYLAAGRASYDEDNPGPSPVLGSRLSAVGRRLDATDALPVLYQPDHPVADPTLAASGDGFVLVVEQDDGPGRHRLYARALNVTPQ